MNPIDDALDKMSCDAEEGDYHGLVRLFRREASRIAGVAQHVGAQQVGQWLRSRAQSLPDGGSISKAELLHLAGLVMAEPQLFEVEVERCLDR